MGNGEVIARVGEHADKPEYVVTLFLPFNYSQRPTTSLLQWFVELLQSRGSPFHTLAEAAHGLEHPAAYAEIQQYHQHHKWHTELKVNQQAIMAKIKQEDDALSGIEHHMEAFRLHECLTHLKGQLDICWELTPHNFAPHWQNSHRHRHSGPEGPP